MRLPVVRLIAAREIRDLLRDRRSVLLIVLTPLVLYPFFGLAGVVFAKTTAEQKTLVGIVGAEQLPPTPPLLDGDTFADGLKGDDPELGIGPIEVVKLPGDAAGALQAKTVDVVLTVPPNFAAEVAARGKPQLTIEHRDGEEKSKLASRRLKTVVQNWQAKLRAERFEKMGLPKDFEKVFTVQDPNSAKPKLKVAADEMRDTLARALPFILMMWLVAGAIQPAVDLTAGEKERGTMETLLISPAERSEIVLGKFLAVTGYAFASVVWNTIWLAAACTAMEWWIGYPIINKLGVLGCVALGIPMAMLFSAVCIALGVFARSTKEGQYYLVPLVFVAMPLAFWSMMPGAELDFGTALVPVAGAMLLQQKLLAVTADPIPWAMFGPVLGGLTISVTVALWLAVRQFRREDVLFREIGGDKGGRLGRLFSA
jgi:sodium transport system permease protein